MAYSPMDRVIHHFHQQWLMVKLSLTCLSTNNYSACDHLIYTSGKRTSYRQWLIVRWIALFIISTTGPWTADQAVSRIQAMARDMLLCFALARVLANYYGNLANFEVL